jgi:hypothetical protein
MCPELALTILPIYLFLFKFPPDPNDDLLVCSDNIEFPVDNKTCLQCLSCVNLAKSAFNITESLLRSHSIGLNVILSS